MKQNSQKLSYVGFAPQNETRAALPEYTPINGGHNSYSFTGNTSELRYKPFKFSGESDSIKALRKEALESKGFFRLIYRYHKKVIISENII